MFVLPWSISTSDSLIGLGRVETGGCLLHEGLVIFRYYIDKVLRGGVFFSGKISRYQIKIQV